MLHGQLTSGTAVDIPRGSEAGERVWASKGWGEGGVILVDLILFCPNRNRAWSSQPLLPPAAAMAQVYACSCLNVRLLPTAPPPNPAAQPEDPQFAVVYVGDEGIRVVSIVFASPESLSFYPPLMPRPIPISPSVHGRAVYPLTAHRDAQDSPPSPASYATLSSIAYIKSSPSMCREKKAPCCPQTSG